MSEPSVAAAKVNGIRMAFRRWPAPAAAAHPPVVLLHGVLQTGEGMRHLAEQLAMDGEVIVPDLRGRGATEQPHVGYDAGTMADDVAALLDYLGVRGAVFVGRMTSGIIAYHLAARRPDLARGVVLGDADPEIEETHAERILERVRSLPPRFSSRAEAERFYEEGLGLSPARARHDLPSDLEEAPDGSYRWRHNLDVVNRIVNETMPRSDWQVIGGVRCPALVLHGQRGSMKPESIARMQAEMSRVSTQMIYGSGYDVFLGPGEEQSLAAIQLFLRGLGESGA